MEGQRAVFFFILLLFIILTPDNQPRRRPRFGDNHLQLQRQQDFDVLANSTYGDLDGNQKWLNLTGFREDDGYQWEILGKVKEQSLAQWSRSLTEVGGDLPFYNQVSGEIRGTWSRSAFSSTNHPFINLTALDPRKEYLSSFWQRNITEQNGELSLTLHDNPDADFRPREINAEIAIYSDSAPGNGWQTMLYGVHLPDGSVVMTSASTKFNALPALPHFTTNEQAFEQATLVMNRTVARLWERKIDQESDPLGLAHCEVVVLLQPTPVVPAGSGSYLRQIEAEIDHPEGAPIGEPPPLSYSAVIFSPDCGYVLEADTMFGPKIEAYTRLAGRLTVAFVIILCLHIFLLKRQMEQAATPSTRSRIAFQGIVIAALGDGLVTLGLLALGMSEDAGYLVIAAATFLSFIHVAVLEVKFVFDIWTVQVGDPMRAEHVRQRRANPPPTAPAQPPTELPLPATAPRITDGAVPILIGSDGDLDQPPSIRSSFAAIYSRFYFGLVCLMFLSLWSLSWPRSIRSFYANTLVTCYFCLWWPQIYRNAMRNCRKALSWEYVIGSTLLRTVFVLYWYLSPRNIRSVETSPSTAFVLMAWIWLQVALLAIQQFLGPRLFVRDSWCPPAYDYHPILREDDDDDVDVEAAAAGGAGGGGMSISLLASASEAKDDKDNKTRKTFDCAICMNEIDVPVVSANSEGTGTAWLEQRKYMVTPCRHIFHAECLEGWMDLRLVCPVCRESLPPL